MLCSMCCIEDVVGGMYESEWCHHDCELWRKIRNQRRERRSVPVTQSERKNHLHGTQYTHTHTRARVKDRETNINKAEQSREKRLFFLADKRIVFRRGLLFFGACAYLAWAKKSRQKDRERGKNSQKLWGRCKAMLHKHQPNRFIPVCQLECVSHWTIAEPVQEHLLIIYL